jgi:hypothetical protein
MYAWSSGQFIGMITVGGLLAVAFVLYEWKLAPVPIMPCRRPCTLSPYLMVCTDVFSAPVPSQPLPIYLRPVAHGWNRLLWELLLQ